MNYKKIQFSPVDISKKEIKKVVETLKSGWITTGLVTKEFEKENFGILSNGKSGLFELCDSLP